MHPSFVTGIYIYRRMIFDQSNNTEIWKERMKKFFQSAYYLLCRNLYNFVFPVYKCSDLQILIYLCSKFEDNRYFEDEINLIYRDINYVIDTSMCEEDNCSDKYLLYLLLKSSRLEVKYYPEVGCWDSVSLMDINHFFLHRYLLDIEATTPECIKRKLLSITDDPKRINVLLSQLSPNTSGLNSYIAGFAWALLESSIEDETKMN